MAKKSEKTVAEKPTRTLSPKRQTELDHINGKHKTVPGDYQAVSELYPLCGFCERRAKKYSK